MSREIKLGGSRAGGKSAIVDSEDYEELSKYNWWCNSDGYAIRIEYKSGEYYRQIFMHKEIHKVPEGFQVDHINRNVLDNRKSNLRTATPSQNQANREVQKSNTSGYKGVSYDKKAGKWRSSITKDGKQYHLGFYEKKRDAAKAFNVKAIELYGEFSVLNEVDHEDFVIKERTYHSKYRGVTYSKRRGRYQASITKRGKLTFLGYFDNEHDAARMYNFWASDMHGKSARLNSINEEFSTGTLS